MILDRCFFVFSIVFCISLCHVVHLFYDFPAREITTKSFVPEKNWGQKQKILLFFIVFPQGKTACPSI